VQNKTRPNDERSEEEDMLVTNKSWTLDPREFARVMSSYVSCRDVSRIPSTCRKCGGEIQAGGRRVQFALRRSDGFKMKAGFVCRQCIERARADEF
jgi:hypothetical protein